MVVWKLARKTEALNEKTCLSGILPKVKPMWTALALNPGSCSEKATSRTEP
jgi:hypothetical protein